MKSLTKKPKKLTYDDKREIEQLKRDMISQAGGCCSQCHKPFNLNRLPQMAHVISKADRNIKKYGYEVVHHRLGIIITCNDSKCNDGVMINTSKTELIKEHLKPIYEDLERKGYVID